MTYDASAIELLEGLEAVRARPGMYIGGTDADGLHHLIWEILDNSVDEALNGHAKVIRILCTETACTIEDDGRGIPFDIHPKAKKPAVELILTTLHSGGKFNSGAYKTAGGLHGVGSSVVNALSSSLDVVIRRNGREYRQAYARGVPSRPTTKKAPKKARGTQITFVPDPQIFKGLKFDPARVQRRVETKAYLTPGVIFDFNGRIVSSKGGLRDLVADLVKSQKLGDILETPFVLSEDSVQVALTWTASPLDMESLSQSFANGIPTRDGGAHLSGLKAVVAAAVLDYGRSHKLFPRKPVVTSDDVREGLLACIHVFHPNPQFQGQTKDRLNNPEVRGGVVKAVRGPLDRWLLTTTAGKYVVQRAIDAAKARTAARAAKQQVARKSVLGKLRLPGKLADCSSQTPADCELFIVEGDSAGGSAKQGRDRRTQAVLPLRGKVLNAISAGTKKAVKNKELQNVLDALGCGYGASFDIRKLRYGRIILLMDADVDGHHIATLLLAFFYTVLPELIYAGKIYLAQPPLYRVQAGKSDFWAKDDDEKDAFLSGLRKSTRLAAEVSRFKGLGEMMPKTLFETTMDPDSRTLLQVSIADGDELLTAAMLSDLMGTDASMRTQMVKTFRP